MNGKTTDQDIERIAQEAAQWLCELDYADEARRAEFVSWLSSSRQHMEELLRMLELDAVLKESLQSPELDVLEFFEQHVRGVVESGRRKLALVTQARESSASQAGAGSGYLRTIKKYPNRRFYDTVESRYVTLADLRRLVVERIDFVVVTKNTQEDITRSVLLQLVAEQEQTEQPLLSRDFLTQIIRCHGEGLHEVIGSYLEQSLKLFESQRGKAGSGKRSTWDPEGPVNSLAQRNFQRWRAVQDEIYRTLVNAGRGGRMEEETEKVGGWGAVGVPKE